MQSLGALSVSDLLTNPTKPKIRIEVFLGAFSPVNPWYKYGEFKYGEQKYGGSGWIPVEDLPDIAEDILSEMTISLGGAFVDPEPIAAEWSAKIFNKDALFFPSHPTSDLTSFFSMGRRVRLSIGIEVGGTDYWWYQITGPMNRPIFEENLLEINLTGQDYTQVLADTTLNAGNNYWGTTKTISTVAAQYDYVMNGDTTGLFYATWDGVDIFYGNTFYYDAVNNKFWFNADETILNGVNNLVVHYFQAQSPENVIADLLVIANLYANQADALADMDYTATGITIDRVGFPVGTSILEAIKLICERCNYRFRFKYDQTPYFKPKATIKAAGSEDLELTCNQYGDYKYYEDDSELFNNVVIEGEEQNVPEGLQSSETSKLRDSALDSTSINIVGEKTLPIDNHLFQDQAELTAMAATLLAEYKDVKKYIDFKMAFSPIPLERGDTVKLNVRLTAKDGRGSKYASFKYGDGTKYGDNGIILAQRGLVRDIKIDSFQNAITLEEVAYS